ncbi:ABC transporter ATP-binding protein [Aquisalimonas asiatica]|uniref:Peptide/nickel transport system ATP-binding protein n=1 Tax=Aquisalimonas asiatica TaxID=406100 RepID=A0A1H8S4K4_9GAMM|nr:ATP-binding cassette domain-containing protein [Aquisalimonas asiatica]SEO73344.1 peptide/nickel transport system ATP-binding protein [Aquisalimonas asiatica]
MVPGIEIENLSVFAGDDCLVENLSLTLNRGERLTILGETGAGKSILAQAVMGLLPPGMTTQGRIRIDGRDLRDLDEDTLHQLWGRTITMLPQEPWHSLDPLMRSQQQVAEVYECVLDQSRSVAQQSAHRDLDGVGLANDGAKLPGELSGGMAQRLAFCAATAGGARIILADEPTKGLDASKRDYVATLLTRQADDGAVLTITHDIDVARQLGGRIIVMRHGQVVEEGSAGQLLAAARAEYTRELMAASPALWESVDKHAGRRLRQQTPVIQARQLSKVRGGKRLFHELDLDVFPGEVIGVTGDSGCGKSTLGDILLGLLPPDTGTVQRAEGIPGHKYLKLYQDPPAAFAPGVPLGRLFDDLIQLHGLDADRLPPLLEQMRLAPELLERPAGDVSGGELQRLAIARTMLLEPVLLFADEPVSRLDPITSRDIILMLGELARTRNYAVLLVSHDPVLVDRVCHRVLRLD